MISEDIDFLMGCLERVTELRKDNEKIQELLEMEDILSDPLYSVTEAIVQGMLRNYAPETMESFVSAIRKGSLDVQYSKGGSPE
jgi:hypothetical protein